MRVNHGTKPKTSPAPLQAVRLCGSQAGKHNGQRQPPVRRAGARAAGQRHRQLCFQDDRLAEAMRGRPPTTLACSPSASPTFLLFLFLYLIFFIFLQNVHYQNIVCALYPANRGCSCVLSLFLFSWFFPVDGIQNGSEEVQDEGVVCVRVCACVRAWQTSGRESSFVSLAGSADSKKKSSC